MFTLEKNVRHDWATKKQQWEHKFKSCSPSVPGDPEVFPCVAVAKIRIGLEYIPNLYSDLEYKLLSGRYQWAVVRQRKLEDGTHQERKKGKNDGTGQNPSLNNLAFSQMLAESDTCFSGSYFKTSRYASSRYAQSPGAVNWPLPPWALEQVSPVRACMCEGLHVCVRACLHWVHDSVLNLFESANPGTVARQVSCPWEYPGKNTGVSCRFPLKGIFSTKASSASLALAGRFSATEHPAN